MEGASCTKGLDGEGLPKTFETMKHLWKFVDVDGVAPDDNAADRLPRHGVIRRKPSPVTAREAGCRFVKRSWSVVESCCQPSPSMVSDLSACFEARWRGRPIPSPLA